MDSSSLVGVVSNVAELREFFQKRIDSLNRDSFFGQFLLGDGFSSQNCISTKVFDNIHLKYFLTKTFLN